MKRKAAILLLGAMVLTAVCSLASAADPPGPRLKILPPSLTLGLFYASQQARGGCSNWTSPGGRQVILKPIVFNILTELSSHLSVFFSPKPACYIVVFQK